MEYRILQIAFFNMSQEIEDGTDLAHINISFPLFPTNETTCLHAFLVESYTKNK